MYISSPHDYTFSQRGTRPLHVHFNCYVLVKRDFTQLRRAFLSTTNLGVVPRMHVLSAFPFFFFI